MDTTFFPKLRLPMTAGSPVGLVPISSMPSASEPSASSEAGQAADHCQAPPLPGDSGMEKQLKLLLLCSSTQLTRIPNSCNTLQEETSGTGSVAPVSGDSGGVVAPSGREHPACSAGVSFVDGDGGCAGGGSSAWAMARGRESDAAEGPIRAPARGRRQSSSSATLWSVPLQVTSDSSSCSSLQSERSSSKPIAGAAGIEVAVVLLLVLLRLVVQPPAPVRHSPLSMSSMGAGAGSTFGEGAADSTLGASAGSTFCAASSAHLREAAQAAATMTSTGHSPASASSSSASDCSVLLSFMQKPQLPFCFLAPGTHTLMPMMPASDAETTIMQTMEKGFRKLSCTTTRITVAFAMEVVVVVVIVVAVEVGGCAPQVWLASGRMVLAQRPSAPPEHSTARVRTVPSSRQASAGASGSEQQGSAGSQAPGTSQPQELLPYWAHGFGTCAV
mmetsp:Transcript_25171/g.63886  ORF Transcript_25171/g.63886 Transcript_25171/m.63886 type:complete len:445 (+) Transcript_25171:324-1658(+)